VAVLQERKATFVPSKKILLQNTFWLSKSYIELLRTFQHLVKHRQQMQSTEFSITI